MARHRFAPQHYHRTLGSHEPVLRVASGDTIVTATVDARGYDASGARINEPGNPQTGPFFVEGAVPGDTLAVHLERLTPSRGTGWTGSAVAADVLDPDYVAHEWPGSETTGGRHRCRHVHGASERSAAATLGALRPAPGADDRLLRRRAGQRPGDLDGHLGTPRRQHGLPPLLPGRDRLLSVFVEGALFHIGDGHAVQGDGEIVGTGIETSFEVEFGLRVIKDRKILWPRGENETHIFTVGNARPLDQATQHATTEMVRWLGELGLEGNEGHLLLGQCVEYEIGNMFDPAYTVVCKMSKAVLRQIGLAADGAMR